MAYVNCHSYITGQDVQYPVIQVKLKHKVRDLDFGCSNANNSTAFWNTSPAYMTTEKIYYNETYNRWQTNSSYTKSTAGVTNRMSQRYDASGKLDATYNYIYRGTHPVISNKDFDVDDYEVGENVVDLFSTDMVMVKAYLYKLKLSEIYYNGNTPASYTFYDVDNNAISEPYVFAAVQIAMFLKSTGEEIGRYSFLQSDSVNGALAPTRFAFSTEMFDIEDFNVNYLSYFSYYSNYNMFFTDSEKSSMKLYNGEQDVTGVVDHCVVPQFTLYASQGFTASRNSYAFYQFETIDDQGNSLSNAEVKRIASNAVWQYILDCYDNSTEFIDFNTQLTYYYRWYTSSQIQSKIDQYFATDRGYKVKSNGQTISAFTALSNCIVSASPVLIPITDANHAVTNYWNQLAIYIPLTTDVQGGDPEPPDPGPDEDEEADDPDTDYTAEQSDGEVSYTYPVSDNISGEWDTQIPYESSYNNYVFADFKRDSTSPYSNLRAYEMIMEVQATSIYEWFIDHFGFKNQIPLADVITRVYECPISFVDLFQSIATPVGAKLAAPVYGYSGPLTMGRTYNSATNKWEGDPTDVHYYYCSTPRIFELNLGAVAINQVFHNYLDYETKYTLNLPYGGGSIDIDPEYLFPDEHTAGSIILKGYFDLDTGTMLINVKVTGQMYYQTIVNMASDKVVSAVNVGAQIANEFKTSMAMGLALGGSVNSITGAFKSLMEKSGAKEGLRQQRFEEEYGNKLEYRAKSEAYRVAAHQQDVENEARIMANVYAMNHQYRMQELAKEESIARIKHNPERRK